MSSFGLRFLRQRPLYYHYYGKLRFFISDFYCHELKLVVEIDGGKMMFCVRNQSSKVRIYRRTSWRRYADWHYIIDRERKTFQVNR